MMRLQAAAHMTLITPQSAATNATITSQLLDCKGYDEAKIVIWSQSSQSATNTWNTLNLQEADTTDSTNFNNITGFVGGTDFTAPNLSTSVAAVNAVDYAEFNVDLRKRKRYLRIQATNSSEARLLSATALLGRYEQMPSATGAANALGQVGAGVRVTG